MTGPSGAGTNWSTWALGPLVGRDEILDRLATCARQASGGAGSVVVLTGEAGIGKTSVARALVRMVGDQLAVSWGGCTADRTAPALWPWRDLVGDPTARMRDLGEVSGAVGAQRYERIRALRDDLLGHDGDGARLHVIEDLQWADVASALLLAQVAPVISAAPLMVIATLRSGEPTAASLEDAIEEIRRTALVLDLPPLREAEVATIIDALGITSEPALASLVRNRTGGNPLFVTELLRSIPPGDPMEHLLDSVAREVPSQVSEHVQNRLDRLPPPVVEAIGVASVLGADGDVRSVAAILGTSVEATVDLLEQARAARLLDWAPPSRWQFVHELIRDSVYRSLPATRRARHHASVLEVLLASGAAPALCAHHALAAQPLLDMDVGVDLAIRAGLAAVDEHSYEEAVGWYERALAVVPQGVDHHRLAELPILLGEALRQVGEVERARQAFVDGSRRTDDPGLLTRAALGYADPGSDLGIAYRSDDPMTVTLLERAIAAQPAEDSVTAVLLEARLASILYFSDEPTRARDLAGVALDRAQRLGDIRALGAATAVTHDAFGVGQLPLDEQLHTSEQLLTWARVEGSSAALLSAHRARVIDLLSVGDIASMDGEIEAFRRIADPLRAPAYQWWVALWSAMRALLHGDHDEAERRASTAFDVGARPFPSLAFANLSFLLFFLRREQGRFDEMEQATREFVTANPDIPAIRVGLVFLLAEIGRHDEADGLVAAMLDDPALSTFRDRNWPASWFQLARVSSLLDHRDLAAVLLDDRHRPTERCVMVSVGTVCLGARDLGMAWLLHVGGALDDADGRYRSAAELNTRIGARSWLAQTRIDHARLLLDRDGAGDREEAERLAGLASAAATDIGLRSVPSVVESVRARLDTPRAGGRVASEEASAPGVFRSTGSLWELEYAGRSVVVHHARGLVDVAHLLSRPEQAVSALELLGEPGADASGVRGAEVFDERARREIRAKLQELDRDIDEAEGDGDAERASQLREERQSLAELVAKELGLAGRSRRLGDPVERARKTVSTRIRRAIAIVGAAHPELGRHLERSIDTGSFCAYRPEEPTRWRT